MLVYGFTKSLLLLTNKFMKVTIRSDIKGKFIRFAKGKRGCERITYRPTHGVTYMELGMKITASASGDNVLLRSAGGRIEVWSEGEPLLTGNRYEKQNRAPNGGFVGQQIVQTYPVCKTTKVQPE